MGQVRHRYDAGRPYHHASVFPGGRDRRLVDGEPLRSRSLQCLRSSPVPASKKSRAARTALPLPRRARATWSGLRDGRRAIARKPGGAPCWTAPRRSAKGRSPISSANSSAITGRLTSASAGLIRRPATGMAASAKSPVGRPSISSAASRDRSHEDERSRCAGWRQNCRDRWDRVDRLPRGRPARNIRMRLGLVPRRHSAAGATASSRSSGETRTSRPMMPVATSLRPKL